VTSPTRVGPRWRVAVSRSLDAAGGAVTRTRGLIGRHRGIALVLLGALVLRVLFWISFYPAFFFSGDSWVYLGMAWGEPFVGVRFDRPSGYPMFIDLVALGRHHVGQVTAAQHLAGLLTGLLAYATMVRLDTRRWLAVCVAAVLLFDAYTVTVEHQILAEAAFALSVMLSASLLTLHDRGAWTVALSGLLLAYAVTARLPGAFLIPVWLIYLLWARRRVLPIALGLATLVLPLFAYLSWHEDRTGQFNFTTSGGWFLYARIGPIATCGHADIPPETAPMCPMLMEPSQEPNDHLWGGLNSPAHRVFTGGPSSGDPNVNRLLTRFALAIVVDRPIVYTRMVGRDVLSYFDPGEGPGVGAGPDVTLRGQPVPIPGHPPESVEAQWSSGYRSEPRLPREVSDVYGDWVHVPRWLLGPLTAVASILLLLGLVLRGRLPMPRRREAFLLLGGGLALLVGATGTSDYALRYLIPTLPLLCVGIALVLEDFAGAVRGLRRADRGSAPIG
jgi:Dolichyl-phosphate-mannose-protein mannosyltransferase